MKNKISLLIILLISLFSPTVFAQGKSLPALVVLPQKSGVFKLIYKNRKPGNAAVSIHNTSGDEVFSQTIWSDHGFTLPINFTGMRPGKYSIGVTEGRNEEVRQINYEFQTSTTDVQVSRMSPGKYLLAVANSGTDLLSVKIFDGSDNLVHDQSITISGNLNLVYNLTQVSGIPTFEITDKTGNTQVIRNDAWHR